MDIKDYTNPLISVMIIIYDVEKYLHKCIESVLSQSYRNLEIILVVGESGDRCTRICREYEIKDSRITVIDGQNQGRGKARNAGLEHASGEFFVFMDGDDWMESHMIDMLFHMMIDNNLDIAMCNYIKTDVSGNTKVINDKTNNYCEIDGIEAVRRVWYAESFNISPWGKLFKRELWEEVRFLDYKHYDDVANMHRVYIKAQKIGYTSSYVGMYYLVRNDSATRMFEDEKLVVIEIADSIIAFAEREKPELKPAALAKAENLYFHILMQLPKKREYKKIKEMLKERIINYRKMVIKDRRIKKRLKIALYSSYIGINCPITLYRIVNRITER